jgi:hypothetical protein
MEYDENEHCKEVYAHFGLAYYHASVLETGMANAIMQADFLGRWKKKIDAEGKQSFDRSVYETEFDAFMQRQNEQTFGNLIKRFSSTFSISQDLQAKIIQSKDKRDFLAHHYFRERAEKFANREGRDQMISELEEIRELFRGIDKEVELLVAPIFPQLGINYETVERYVVQHLEKARRGEL